MLDTLTNVQKEVFLFIANHIKTKNISPSLQEIAESLEYEGHSTVEKHVNTLVKKGYLHKPARKWRSIKISNLGKIYFSDEVKINKKTA